MYFLCNKLLPTILSNRLKIIISIGLFIYCYYIYSMTLQICICKGIVLLNFLKSKRTNRGANAKLRGYRNPITIFRKLDKQICKLIMNRMLILCISHWNWWQRQINHNVLKQQQFSWLKFYFDQAGFLFYYHSLVQKICVNVEDD